jgi:hypothetical protein
MRNISKIISSLVLATLLPWAAVAGCSKVVTSLIEGDKAPCQGYLYSLEYDAFVRVKIEERNVYESLFNLEKKHTEITQDRLKLALENEKYLQEQIKLQENTNFWYKTMYFFGGVLATGVLASTLSHNLR